MTKLSKAHLKLLTQTIKDNPEFAYRYLLESWNANSPHFGGSGGHRYEGGKHCVYCNRPIKWKPVNPSTTTNDMEGSSHAQSHSSFGRKSR